LLAVIFTTRLGQGFEQRRERWIHANLQRRHAIEPRLRCLQLGGKRQQGRLIAVATGEMHAHRQAICRPMQRHAHRRRTRRVMQRRHRQIFRHALGEGLNIAVLIEIAELRRRARPASTSRSPNERPHDGFILERMENDYSYSELATSFFMISVMRAQMRCTRDDDPSPQVFTTKKWATV
jgi:hypothetical protein